MRSDYSASCAVTHRGNTSGSRNSSSASDMEDTAMGMSPLRHVLRGAGLAQYSCSCVDHGGSPYIMEAMS